MGSDLSVESSIDQEMQQGQTAPAGGGDVVQSIDQEMNQSKYGTLGQQALTAVEGAGKGFAGPVFTGAERALSESGFPGLSPEDQAGREEANPWTHGVSEVGSFAGSLLAGTGEAAILSKIGEHVPQIAAAVGIGGKGAGALGKIGSAAARGAVENAIYQGGDEASKLINGDPAQSAQSALANVGLASLIGGGIGGAAGGVSTLWKNTLGTKVGGVLNQVAERVGGIEGVEAAPALELFSKAGLEGAAPEVKAAISDDPVIKRWASQLNQSDTSNSGREFQQTLKEVHQQAGDVLAESLGKDPKQIGDELDKYTHGKTIGNTLADEFQAQVDPLSAKYEEIGAKYKDAPLVPSRAERGVGAAPGTMDQLIDKVGQLSMDEKWNISPSSDIMREVNRVEKELPNLKTVDDLTAYIKRVGENMQSDPLNGPLNRAGGMIKSVLRDAESDLIAQHIGAEEGEKAVAEYAQVRKAYAAQTELKDALDSRLHIRGSTSGYADRLREAAQTDGEALLRKLSGKGDADLLNVLESSFPKTAEALRNAHVDELLIKSKGEDGINPNRLMNQLSKLSPQIKQFIVPPGSVERVNAIGEVLEKLKDKNYNFSNTGRVSDALNQHAPGTVVGLISLLTGHGPVTSVVAGMLTKYLQKDAPDAIKLGLLKWLGSNKPIDPGAFKSMVDFIHHAQQGNSLMDRAAKAVFNGASKVIPEHMMASPPQVKKLDKTLKEHQTNPDEAGKAGHGTGYYMPDHAIALTGTASNAMAYLNSQRPTVPKLAPLDPPMEPSDSQKAQYERLLSIAEQPLTVAHLLNENQLTSTDVAHANALYPEFMNSLKQKISDQLVNHLAQDKPVPYALKQGLSTLMGQPLDSGLSFPAVQANQMTFSQSASQANAQSQAPQKTKPSVVGMRDMKIGNRYSMRSSDEGDTA